jgi:hypothetical protein
MMITDFLVTQIYQPQEEGNSHHIYFVLNVSPVFLILSTSSPITFDGRKYESRTYRSCSSCDISESSKATSAPCDVAQFIFIRIIVVLQKQT